MAKLVAAATMRTEQMNQEGKATFGFWWRPGATVAETRAAIRIMAGAAGWDTGATFGETGMDAGFFQAGPLPWPILSGPGTVFWGAPILAETAPDAGPTPPSPVPRHFGKEGGGWAPPFGMRGVDGHPEKGWPGSVLARGDLPIRVSRLGAEGLSGLSGDFSGCLVTPGGDSVYLVRGGPLSPPLFFRFSEKGLMTGLFPTDLIGAGEARPALDAEVLREWLEDGTRPTSSTFFSGVRRVGMFQTVRIKRGSEPEIHAWEPMVEPAKAYPFRWNREEIALWFRRHLERAVRRHLPESRVTGAFVRATAAGAILLSVLDKFTRTFPIILHPTPGGSGSQDALWRAFGFPHEEVRPTPRSVRAVLQALAALPEPCGSLRLATCLAAIETGARTGIDRLFLPDGLESIPISPFVEGRTPAGGGNPVLKRLNRLWQRWVGGPGEGLSIPPSIEPGSDQVLAIISGARSGIRMEFPFLDQGLRCFLEGLAGRWRSYPAWPKSIFRIAFLESIPKAWWRRLDGPVEFSADGWLRALPEPELFGILRSSPFVRNEWIDAARLEGMLEEFRRGKSTSSPVLWRILVLRSWERACLSPGEGSPAATASAEGSHA